MKNSNLTQRQMLEQGLIHNVYTYPKVLHAISRAIPLYLRSTQTKEEILTGVRKILGWYNIGTQPYCNKSRVRIKLDPTKCLVSIKITDNSITTVRDTHGLFNIELRLFLFDKAVPGYKGGR